MKSIYWPAFNTDAWSKGDNWPGPSDCKNATSCKYYSNFTCYFKASNFVCIVVVLLFLLPSDNYPIHRVCGNLPQKITIGQITKTGLPIFVTFFKLNHFASSWEYPFTVEYWLIMGLKVMTLENLKPNPSCQSLSSLWFLNTSSFSSSGSLSSSSPTSPQESSSRLFSKVEVAIFQICFRCRERSCWQRRISLPKNWKASPTQLEGWVRYKEGQFLQFLYLFNIEPNSSETISRKEKSKPHWSFSLFAFMFIFESDPP